MSIEETGNNPAVRIHLSTDIPSQRSNYVEFYVIRNFRRSARQIYTVYESTDVRSYGASRNPAPENAPPTIIDVVPDSWTKNWGPSVWDINGREQLKLES